MKSPDSRRTARLLLYPMVALFVALLLFYLYSLPALNSGSGGAPEEAGAAGEIGVAGEIGFGGTAASDGNFSLSQLSVEAAEYRDENVLASGTAGDGNFSLSVREIRVREASPEETSK